MIIVTLIATLSASMVWQQWRAVQVESAERSRTQSAWILSGALDWARLILREDARPQGNRPLVDHLNEPWAVPLAEARLSTFLAADRDPTEDEGPDAFLSGGITDAQARFNLMNLLPPPGGKEVNPLDRAALVRLCTVATASDDCAGRIEKGLLAAQAGLSGGDPAAPLMPRSVEQLVWLGVDPETVRALVPHVVLLTRRTTVNVNTASREVLFAAIDKLDLATAERIVQKRQRTPFESLDKLSEAIPELPKLDRDRVSVSSAFFQVRGRLRLDDRVLEQTSLVERQGVEVRILRRERVSSREQPAS